MYANTRLVTSNQAGIHHNLKTILSKHAISKFKKPVGLAARKTFQEIDYVRKNSDKKIILDAGCGNAEFSFHLAKTYPECLVIGIDKSAKRLRRFNLENNLILMDNCLLTRMDLTDFWLLAAESGWQATRQYLLYPNPWPKSRHIQRRWYAHPAFTSILKLGGQIEIRTNWQIYAEEFCFSFNFLLDNDIKVKQHQPVHPATQFERKYLDSGHRLFSCTGILDIGSPSMVHLDPVNQVSGLN